MCKLINLSERKALLNSVEKKAAGEVCRDYPTGGRIRKSWYLSPHLRYLERHWYCLRSL